MSTGELSTDPAGTVPSALLIHGVQSSALTWWQVSAALRDRGWRVDTVNLAGHGGRPFLGDGIATLADLAEDVATQVGDSHYDVVEGHSLGALVALTLCALRPHLATTVLIEDPPGLAGGVDPVQTAADIEATVAAARADPERMVATLLEDNPLWTETDARNSVASRAALDVERVTASLRANRWDLPAMVRACPVPVHLLAAEGPATALRDPDRAAIISMLPAGAVTIVPSGHSIHRDHPDAWLDVVTALPHSRNR